MIEPPLMSKRYRAKVQIQAIDRGPWAKRTRGFASPKFFPFSLKPYALRLPHTQRETTVFSSMNIRIEAILDLAVPTKDSLRDPRGKKA